MNLPLDWTLKTSVILAFALAATFLLRRRSASLRHAILAIAILCAAIAPLLGTLMPAWHSTVAAPVFFSPAPIPVPAVTTPPIAVYSQGIPNSSPATNAAPVAPAPSDARPIPQTPAPTWKLPNLGRVAAFVWVGGAMLGFAMLIAGMVRLWSIGRRAVPIQSGAWADNAGELARSYGLRRPVRLLQSREAFMLATWGAVRPQILLPTDADTWPADRIRAALLHEFAHIHRNDWIVQMLAGAFRAVYWFNPLAWLAFRKLRHESEQACDNAVIDDGMTPADYAGHLLALARAFNRRDAVWTAALQMARPSTLQRRIAALLNPQANRSRVKSAAIVAIAALLLGVTLPVAAFHTLQAPQAAPSSAPRPLPLADSWGDAVDGVQIRLVLAKSPLEAAEGTPLVQVQIRNRGNSAVRFQDIQERATYEVDGQRYWFGMYARGGTRAPVVVLPGSQSADIPLPNFGNGLRQYEMDPQYPDPALPTARSNGGRLVLKAGKHWVRVGIRPETPISATPVSNRLDFEIPSSPMMPNPQTSDVGNGIRFITGPVDGIAVVRDRLRTFTFNGNAPERANFDCFFTSGVICGPGRSSLGSLQIMKPLGVYSLRVPERSYQHQLLTEWVGYAYPIGESGKGVATIIVSTDSSGNLRADRIDDEAIAASRARALDQLAALKNIRDESYEARLVQVLGVIGEEPATVIWLRADRYPGSNDLLYLPTQTNKKLSSRLQAEKLYSIDEFLKVARGDGRGPKAAAIAALDLVQGTLLGERDLVRISQERHPSLFKALNDLGAAARTASEDDGRDAAVSARKNDALFNALRDVASQSTAIANNPSEYPIAKDPAKKLAGKVQAILRESGYSANPAAVSPQPGKRAMDLARACIEKSPGSHRSVWGSPLNLDRADFDLGPEPDRVTVYIPESAPRGKPQGVAIDVNIKTGQCIDFTNRLE